MLQKQSNKATAAWAMPTGDTDSSTSCYSNRSMKQQQREQWLLETQTHQHHATETEQWSNSSVSNDYWRHRLTSIMLQKQSNEATAAWAMTTGDMTHQQYATGTEQWSNSSVSNDYWRHRLTSIMLQKQSNKTTAAWAMTTGDRDSSTACYRNRAMKQQQREQCLLETQTHQQHATETEQWGNSSMSNGYWRVETQTRQQHATGTERWSNSSMSNDYWRHYSPTACYRNRAMQQQQHEQWLLETRIQQQYATGTEQWSNISVSNCYWRVEIQTRQQYATGIEQWGNRSMKNDYWRHILTNSMLQEQSNEATSAWATTTEDTDSPAVCYRNRAMKQHQREQRLLKTWTPAACYGKRAMRQKQHEQWLLETRLTNSMLQEHNNEVTAAWAMTTGNIDSPTACYRNRAMRQQRREQWLLESGDTVSSTVCYRNRAMRQQKHEQWLLETYTHQQHATGTEQWSNISVRNGYGKRAMRQQQHEQWLFETRIPTVCHRKGQQQREK